MERILIFTLFLKHTTYYISFKSTHPDWKDCFFLLNLKQLIFHDVPPPRLFPSLWCPLTLLVGWGGTEQDNKAGDTELSWPLDLIWHPLLWMPWPLVMRTTHATPCSPHSGTKRGLTLEDIWSSCIPQRTQHSICCCWIL